jgi:hypothetical protein
MTNEQAVTVFRIVNKFSIINEHIECKSILDALILTVNLSEYHSKIGALFALRKYLEEKNGKETTQLIFEKLQELNKIPKHDLSTYEGFIKAFAEAMASGASFGGPMSGAGTNADINATGMAGIDKLLNNKKRKIDNILSRSL